MVRDKSMKNDMVNNRIASEKEFEEVFRYYYRPLFLFAYGYVMDEGEAMAKQIEGVSERIIEAAHRAVCFY